ncbi:MAG: 5-oxoprolinase subunit PxpA [Bacteroidota bacterium]
MIRIDINADLGEGAGMDDRLMPLVSSCNIACGGHFGNIDSMKQTIDLAQAHGVRIGAHPSFPDRDGFGRRVITMTKSELKASLMDQLEGFYQICAQKDAEVHHVKLHGALYNYAAKDAPTSDAVVEAIIDSGKRPKLYVPYGSILHKKAENLLPLVFEAFIDRRYRKNGSLVSRDENNAVISDPEAAWEQLYRMVTQKTVIAVNGEEIGIEATTYCIHGDHPESLPILEYIHRQCKQNEITLV